MTRHDTRFAVYMHTTYSLERDANYPHKLKVKVKEKHHGTAH
jgi:hypothetical protein